MGTVEKTRRKVQLWKKALLHFSLFFVLGLFTGITPSNVSSMHSSLMLAMPQSSLSPALVLSLHAPSNRSMMEEKVPIQPPLRQLILITTLSKGNQLAMALLTRLSNTIKLVPPPHLWIVVEPKGSRSPVYEILMRSGLVYRHLESTGALKTPDEEAHYQKNLALAHVETHRLRGIVHFADISNFYDLQFFGQLRESKAFSVWPIAFLSANRYKVVVGASTSALSYSRGGWLKESVNKLLFEACSFSFNSSLLWEDGILGENSLADDTHQDMVGSLQEKFLNNNNMTKLERVYYFGVHLWHLNITKYL